MKFVKWILIPLVVLFLILFGVYQFGKDYAIDKMSEELESSGKIEEVKEILRNDPGINQLMKEFESSPEWQQVREMVKTEGAKAATIDHLPFDTKEEAIKVVVDRVGISKSIDMYERVRSGETTKEEAMTELAKEFTEEEMTALKFVLYKELYLEK